LNKKFLALALLLLGLSFADLNIPSSQPICRLYGMIQVFGTVAGVLVAAYSGFILASSHELTERNAAKALLSGVIIGLVIIWLAPVLVENLVNSTGICGW
jgi:formate-dependent nitrite reductase membrane component NrfD